MVSSKNILVIDAMGGDHAPLEIIKGAHEASSLANVEIYLSGDSELIKKTAAEFDIPIDGIKTLEATQKIAMDQSPSNVIRYGRDSSIFKGTAETSKLNNSAFLSAGNTGAVMACSLFNMKRIPGVIRPAIAVVVPLGDKKLVLVDAGANVDCKPIYLKQFAIMGRIYAESILGVSNPSVGLLNIGSEETKGNSITIEAHRLLNETNMNFYGNVEGRDIFEGVVDVAVCDGFIGNILLKSIEGLAGLLLGEIKSMLTKNIFNKLMAIGLKKSLTELKNKFDYEEYGGAYLLGVNGITIISHGSSKAKAIYNAARVACEGIKSSLVTKIRNEINDK